MNKIEQALLKSRHLNLADIDSATVTPLIDHMKQKGFFTPRELDEKRVIHPACKDQAELNYFLEEAADLAGLREQELSGFGGLTKRRMNIMAGGPLFCW